MKNMPTIQLSSSSNTITNIPKMIAINANIGSNDIAIVVFLERRIYESM